MNLRGQLSHSRGVVREISKIARNQTKIFLTFRFGLKITSRNDNRMVATYPNKDVEDTDG